MRVFMAILCSLLAVCSVSADPAQPDGLCTLYGGEATTAAPGEQLSFAAPEADSTAGTSAASDRSASGVVDEADAKMSALTTLQTKLDEYGMRSDVTRIEFADTEQIAFLYQVHAPEIRPKQ